MKKTLLIICACVCACMLQANELYTVWTSSNKTITFYYDNSRSSRSGDKIEVITSSSLHWGTISSVAEKMVLTSSMQNYSPTSLEDFFVGGNGSYSMIAIKSITGLEYLNTANVTNMSGMFRGMSSLQSLNLTTFNTAKVTDMHSMFSGCQSLTTLSLSSFSSAVLQNMDDMFNECQNLTSLTFGNNFTASQVKYFSEVFLYCEKLTTINLSKFNLVNALSMHDTFRDCKALNTVMFPTNLNTLNVSNMEAMFKGCTALSSMTLQPFNVSNCANFYNMFDGCTSLQTVDMRNLVFYSSLGMYEMFNGCSNLRTIYCTEDLSSTITYGYHMFYGCTKLQGNNGTVYDANNTNATYARPDRGSGQPGYFTTNLGPIAVCETPTNLVATDVQKTTATLQWNAAAGQTQWQVKVYKNNQSGVPAIYNVQATSYNLQNLEPETKYLVQVRAVCGENDYSDYTSIVRFTTLDNPTPPECAMPTNVQVEDITTNTAKVTWTPGGTESGWEVSYMKKGGAYRIKAGSSTQPTFVLEGLEPMIEYNVYVRAVCGVDNNSEYAIRSFITSPEIVEECNAPTEMMTQILTDTKALVAWIPAGTETKWKFIYKRTADANYMSVTVTGDPYYELKDLEPNTSYSANVYAICSDDNYSAWYNDGIDFTFTTRKAEGIDNLQAQKAATKIIRDGQLLILVGDKTYDARGAEVR